MDIDYLIENLKDKPESKFGAFKKDIFENVRLVLIYLV